MNINENKAFTLVELIVVVTILAILATIGFVSYSSYLVGVRDANRSAQIVSIHDGIELYRTKNELPLPDSNIEVLYGSYIMGYQGTAGKNTLETIDFTKGGKDPKNDTYFSYYVTKDRKYFQLMAFYEEETGLSSQFYNTSNALDYSNLNIDVFGKNLGILTDINKTPINELAGLAGGLDISNLGTTEYIAHFKDQQTISGSGTTLGILKTLQDKGGKAIACKDILESGASHGDGVYKTVNSGRVYDLYCDMTIDGGGWTLIDGVSGRFGASVSTENHIEPNLVNYNMETETLEGLLSNLNNPVFKYRISRAAEDIELNIKVSKIDEAIKKGILNNTNMESYSWVTMNGGTIVQPETKSNYTRYNLRSKETYAYRGHLKSYSAANGPHSWWINQNGSMQDLYLNSSILSVSAASLPTFGGLFTWVDNGSTTRFNSQATDPRLYSEDSNLANKNIVAGLYVR